MVKKSAKQIIQELITTADIQINGNKPWDMQVQNPQFYQRVLAGGSVALGESYMDGWWDCRAMDQLFYKLLKTGIDKKVKNHLELMWSLLKAKLLNRQSISRAYEVGKVHYDVGNDLYRHMLGKTMAYSCGYWKDTKNTKNLDKAQKAKFDLICKKIKLKKGMRILDIGCGWSSFAKYAAEKYKVSVAGITISKEQAKFGKELCKNLPVEIRLQDYRNLKEKFDGIVSIGMFEHVGPKNYKTFFKMARNNLKPDGIFLLHTIGGKTSSMDPWLDKYIFPNAIIPTAKQITTAANGLFVLEDWHNFSIYYDITLLAWYKNFEKNWNKIKNKYDERFFRMWKYYLLSCAGSFRARKNQLWQIVFSKNGLDGGYRSVR